MAKKKSKHNPTFAKALANYIAANDALQAASLQLLYKRCTLQAAAEKAKLGIDELSFTDAKGESHSVRITPHPTK